MVVTCTRCATQFQFDESRLPLNGAKVRCSRCRETFFLAHPTAESERAVQTSERPLVADSMARPMPWAEADASLKEEFLAQPEKRADSASSDEGFEWDFDFDAQSDSPSRACESSDQSSGREANRSLDSPQVDSSKAETAHDEQRVFASVDDLADWLADRSETLETDVMGVPDESSEPSPLQGLTSSTPEPIALGRMKTRPNEKASDAVKLEIARSVDPEDVSRLTDAADGAGEGLLAELLGVSRAQVPGWLRMSIQGTAQVLGWGLTVGLLTWGLINGLGSTF